MIGMKGKAFIVEFAMSDPRALGPSWFHHNGDFYPTKLEAVREAKAVRKNGTTRVRVVQVTHECVWATDEAEISG